MCPRKAIPPKNRPDEIIISDGKLKAPTGDAY
jgi:hypothetical protein